MFIYMYIYICTQMCLAIYVYVYCLLRLVYGMLYSCKSNHSKCFNDYVSLIQGVVWIKQPECRLIYTYICIHL